MGQTVSISLRFSGNFVVFPERRHLFPKMHRIYIEVIIGTFKPFEFIALYSSFNKSTIRRKFVVKLIRTTFLKTLTEVVIFFYVMFESLRKPLRKCILLNLLSLPVTWCTNNLTFNNCTLCPHCIYVFCVYPRTNIDSCHLQNKLIGFYNRNENVYCAVRTGSLNKEVCASSLTF